MVIIVIILMLTIRRGLILRLRRTPFLTSRRARRLHRYGRRLLRAAFRRALDIDGFLDYAIIVRTAGCGRLDAVFAAGDGAGDGGAVGLLGGGDG